jgi:hypothetical protein
MPTPKSKPSRMKNPVHRIAMTMNQNGTMMTSILDSGYGRVGVGVSARGRQLVT